MPTEGRRQGWGCLDDKGFPPTRPCTRSTMLSQFDGVRIEAEDLVPETATPATIYYAVHPLIHNV